MKELIQKITKDEALQEQIKSCEDVKAFAKLLDIDEVQAEKIFTKVKDLVGKDEIPDDMLERVSGGCDTSNETQYSSIYEDN